MNPRGRAVGTCRRCKNQVFENDKNYWVKLSGMCMVCHAVEGEEEDWDRQREKEEARTGESK